MFNEFTSLLLFDTHEKKLNIFQNNLEFFTIFWISLLFVKLFVVIVT